MSAPAAGAVAVRQDPRAVAARSDAWVVEYEVGAPVPLSFRSTTVAYPVDLFEIDHLQVFVAGTVFDRSRLSTSLGLAGAPGQAQIVAEAYRQHGDTFVDRIVGRCSILLADRGTRRLLAVRDQMGMFPLFYARTRRGLLFSTSCAALADQPEVSRSVNRLVVAEHMAHRWIDSAETYFADIRRVPPGRLLEIANGKETVRRYWDPGAEGSDERLSDEEAIHRFNGALRTAVARCLGTSRTAILLSGGFDSVSVAATAAALLREQGRTAPHALSVVFPDPECNEENLQRSVAQGLGMTQDLVPMAEALGGRGLLPASLALGREWSSPMLNLWSPAYLELSRRGVRQGCDTILNGTGGDEWLNVTPCIAADLIRAGRYRDLARFIGVFQRSFKLSRARVLRDAIWRFGVRRLIGGALAGFAPSVWHESRRRREVARTPDWIAPDPALRRQMDARIDALIPPARPGKGGFYEREMQVALNHPLVAIEYEEHFEFGQRVGATLLSPYVDPDLVRVLYRMSPVTLTVGGRSKGLVRSAVSQLFPGLGFERHKKANAQSYFRNTLGEQGPREWSRRGGAPNLVRLGIVNGPRIQEIAAGLSSGSRPEQNYLFWDILNVDGWVQKNTVVV